MYAGPIADLVAGAVAIGMMVLEMRQITRLERARTTECIT